MTKDRPSVTAFGLAIGSLIYVAVLQDALFPGKVPTKWDATMVTLFAAGVLRILEWWGERK